MKVKQVLRRLSTDEIISNMTFVGKVTSDSHRALKAIQQIVGKKFVGLSQGLNNDGITKRSWIDDSMLDNNNIIVNSNNYTYHGYGENLCYIPLRNLNHDDLSDFESAIHNINKALSMGLSFYVDEKSMCLIFGNRELNSVIRTYAVIKYDEDALVNDAIEKINIQSNIKKLSDFISELKLISLLSDGAVIDVAGTEDYDNLIVSGMVREVNNNELVLEDIDTYGKLVRLSFDEDWMVMDIRKMLTYKGDGTIRMSVPRLRVINGLQDSEDELPF